MKQKRFFVVLFIVFLPEELEHESYGFRALQHATPDNARQYHADNIRGNTMLNNVSSMSTHFQSESYALHEGSHSVD